MFVGGQIETETQTRNISYLAVHPNRSVIADHIWIFFKNSWMKTFDGWAGSSYDNDTWWMNPVTKGCLQSHLGTDLTWENAMSPSTEICLAVVNEAMSHLEVDVVDGVRDAWEEHDVVMLRFFWLVIIDPWWSDPIEVFEGWVLWFWENEVPSWLLWCNEFWGWSVELMEALEEVLNIRMVIVPWHLTTLTKTPLDQYWQCWVILQILSVGDRTKSSIELFLELSSCMSWPCYSWL